MATQNNPDTKPVNPDTSAAGSPSKTNDLGADQVQKQADIDAEKGYHGTTNDDGDYSVAGSVAGKNKPAEDKK